MVSIPVSSIESESGPSKSRYNEEMMRRSEVLFVCIGNACRSQMAEGFAQAYGRDVMQAYSAGLSPISSVPLLTRQVMFEKNVAIDAQYPKGVEVFRGRPFDAVINMSGLSLPANVNGPVEEWLIADPYGRSDGVYRQVRDMVETRVMQLILRLRNPGQRTAAPTPPPVKRTRIKLRGV